MPGRLDCALYRTRLRYHSRPMSRSVIRSLAALAAAAVCLAGCASSAVPAAPAVVLVRHAEAAAGDDPGLSEAGAARAAALAEALRGADVRTIYVTQYRRTKDTAAPVAAAAGVTPIEIAVERGEIADHAADMARRIAAHRGGGTILVVGHSNTVPAVVTALTGTSAAPIAHQQYDTIYVVNGRHAVVARYGAATP